MRRRWQFLVGLIALAASVGAGQYAYTQYNQIVATAPVAVAAVPIPPYTLVTPDMLKVRSLPRPLLREAIYTTADELTGKMTTQALVPGQVIYHHQAVSPQAFRLSSPDLEVISLPVAVEQAVGGAVRTGSRVNLYRMLVEPNTTQPAPGTTRTAPRDRLAEVKLLAGSVPVVDVREKSGGPATQDTSPSQNKSSSTSSQSQRAPIQIVTLAVPHEQALEIVRLMGEAGTTVKFWLTLAPIQPEDLSQETP